MNKPMRMLVQAAVVLTALSAATTAQAQPVDAQHPPTTNDHYSHTPSCSPGFAAHQCRQKPQQQWRGPGACVLRPLAPAVLNIVASSAVFPAHVC